MTNLSPAAQAVLDAAEQVPIVLNYAQEIPAFCAAALRVAVEETQGKVVCPTIEMVTTNHRYCLASDILAIAAELEAQ